MSIIGNIGLLKAFFIVFTYSNYYYSNKYGLLQWLPDDSILC